MMRNRLVKYIKRHYQTEPSEFHVQGNGFAFTLPDGRTSHVTTEELLDRPIGPDTVTVTVGTHIVTLEASGEHVWAHTPTGRVRLF
jgi:hypothetical protein